MPSESRESARETAAREAAWQACLPIIEERGKLNLTRTQLSEVRAIFLRGFDSGRSASPVVDDAREGVRAPVAQMPGSRTAPRGEGAADDGPISPDGADGRDIGKSPGALTPSSVVDDAAIERSYGCMAPSDRMVEMAAKAMWEAGRERPDATTGAILAARWDDTKSARKDETRDLARAALAAALGGHGA